MSRAHALSSGCAWPLGHLVVFQDYRWRDDGRAMTQHNDAFGEALLAHLDDCMDGRVLILEVDDDRS